MMSYTLSKTKDYGKIDYAYRNEDVYHENPIYTPNSTIDEARE